MRNAIALVLLSLLVAGTSDAYAQARHERVQISEIKSKGEVVGARIKLTLRASGSSWKDVLVGIGPGKGINNNSNIKAYRAAAAEPGGGHLIHQFKAIPKPGEAQEVTFQVKYADVPQLKPGQPIQIISAWRPTSAGGAIHAWGLTRYGITEATYKLPGKASNAQKTNSARRASKRVVSTSKSTKSRFPKTKTTPVAKSAAGGLAKAKGNRAKKVTAQKSRATKAKKAR